MATDKKHACSIYRDLPVGLCEQRGCRYVYQTKKGNPIGQIKCQLKDKKWVTAVYGDRRTRKQAIDIVHKAKLADRTSST